MNFFERTVLALSAEGEVPVGYGRFHLLFIGITIASVILLCLLFGNAKEKSFRRLLFVAWLVLLLLEGYKQTILAFEVTDGGAEWSFSWYHFPFQLCSSPLYLLPLAIFLPEGKARDGALVFLATYSLLGGICVYIEPSDVFVPVVGRCIQSMVHHGLQICIGVLIFVRERKNLRMKNFLLAVPYFAALVAAAMALNAAVYVVLPEREFNMFFISPYYPKDFPIIGRVYPDRISYPLFLLLYIVVLSAGAFLLYAFAAGISRLTARARAGKNRDKGLT